MQNNQEKIQEITGRYQFRAIIDNNGTDEILSIRSFGIYDHERQAYYDYEENKISEPGYAPNMTTPWLYLFEEQLSDHGNLSFSKTFNDSRIKDTHFTLDTLDYHKFEMDCYEKIIAKNIVPTTKEEFIQMLGVSLNYLERQFNAWNMDDKIDAEKIKGTGFTGLKNFAKENALYQAFLEDFWAKSYPSEDVLLGAQVLSDAIQTLRENLFKTTEPNPIIARIVDFSGKAGFITNLLKKLGLYVTQAEQIMQNVEKAGLQKFQQKAGSFAGLVRDQEVASQVSSSSSSIGSSTK